MSNYNDRVFELVRQYRYNPRLFSEDQVDQIQDLANQFDVPFKRKTDEFNLRKAVTQLSSGFLEGFTTIPVGKIGGKEPKTTYEAIAHSLGHLAGFAPGIMAAPLSLGAKGLAKLGANTTAKYMQKGAAIAGTANHWSIPMMAGDFAKKGSDKLLQKAAIETLDGLKKGGGARAVLDQSVHLGAASAMSSIWKGPDEIINSGVHGAVAGGAFGGLGQMRVIGNYLKSKNPSDYRKGEQRLKGVIGAAMLGLPTALQDQPAEMIIYQTLLGGFFGYNARPAVEAEGGKFIKDLMYSGNKDHIFYPETHPNYGDYSKGAKNYINKEATRNAKNYYRRNMEAFGYDRDMVDTMIEENVKAAEGIAQNKRPTQDMIDREYRAQAKDFYLTYSEGKGHKFYIHKDIVDELNNNFDKREEPNDTNPNKSEVPENTNLKNMKDRESLNNVFAITYRKGPGGKAIIDVVGGISPDKIGVNGLHHNAQIGDRRVNRPADVLENTEYITFDSVFEMKEMPNGKYRATGRAKPLNTIGNNWTGKSERTWSKDAQWKVDVRLDQHDRYVYGGIKNKGVLTVRKYHTDKDLYTVEQLINSLSVDGHTSRKELQDSFNKSFEHFVKYYPNARKNPEALRDLHEKAWKSNVLVEAERNNMYEVGSNNLNNIHNLMKKGYAKNVIEWNKREQLYHDKSMPLPKGSLGGKIEFAIFNDVEAEVYKDITGVEKKYDSDTDGTVYFRNSDFKTMMESVGLDYIPTLKNGKKGKFSIGMNKPVMIVKTPEGTMIVKAAGVNAPKLIRKYMKDNDIRALIMKSAAKHTGNLGETKFNDFDINLLKKGEYNHTGELLKFDMKDTDIRINLNTHENPRTSLKKQRIAKQLGGAFNRLDSPGAMEALWNDVYLPNIKGNPELNARVKEIIKTNPDKFEKINVDDIDLEIIHDIFTNHGGSKLAKKLARQMGGMERDGDLRDIDTFSKEDYQQYVYRNNRILDVADFSQSQRETSLFGRKFFEDVYRKYMLNRLTSPKYEYSAKTWMAPKHPHVLLSANIKDGHFKYNDGMKGMKIRYDNNDTTLGEAWAKFKKTGKDPDAFEMLVIRVPSDSMSGTRVLRFDGFTGDKGHNIITNAKDNAYLGGADKDSDSTFIYQNMPKKVIKAFRKKQDQWEVGDRWVDGKDKANDRKDMFDAEIEDEFNYIGSKFSPSMRRMVADNAAKGNQGLGIGIVAKNNLLAVADHVNLKGKLEIPIYNKNNNANKTLTYVDGKGYYAGKVVLELKPNAHKEMIKIAREMVNRSADAADYSKSLDPASYPDLLLKTGFKTKGNFIDAWGNKKDLVYGRLAQTPLHKDISNAIQMTKPNVKMTWEQLSARFEQTGDLSEYSNFSSFIGNHIKKSNLTGKLLGEDAFVSYVQNLEKVQNNIIQNQQKLSQVSKLNRLSPGFRLNPSNIKDSRFKLEGDFHQLTSWDAITKKGQQIYDALDRMGIPDKQKNQFIDKILEPIARKATSIKEQSDNYLNMTPEELNFTNSSHTYFDDAVLRYNLELNGLAGKYNKVFGEKNNLITKDLLKEYFDLWLLSPFEVNGSNTTRNRLAFQSQYVSNKSLKTYVDTHQKIFEMFNEYTKTGKVEDGGFIYQYSPKQNVRQTITKKFAPDNQVDFLRSRAITDKELQIVLEFEKNLDKVPMIRDNFGDFYIQWSKDSGVKTKDGPIGKDLSLIDIKDINAINNYIKDMDNRFTSKGTKLPDNAWRASIDYMDLHMQQFENKFFTSSLENVKTRDGIVMKRVKKYTGTIGMLKDYIHRTNMSMESDLKDVPFFNKKRYPHLRLDEKTALEVNKVVFAKREGKDYKSMKEYKDLPESITIGKDKYSKDKLIETTDRLFTDDFKQFGDQFIYAKDSKGEYMSPFKVVDKKTKKVLVDEKGHWIDIDKNHKYGKYGDFLSWGSNGKFDFKSIEKMLFTSIERGNKMPRVPFEVLKRYVYELGVERHVSKNASKKNAKQLREEYRSSKKTKFHPTGRFKKEEYVPHLNFGRDKKSQLEIENYIQERLQGISNPRERQLTELRIRTATDKSQQEDGGRGGNLIEQLLHEGTPQGDLLGHSPSSLRARSKDEMPGWDNSHNAINIYKENLIRAQTKVIQSMYFRKQIEAFKNSKDFNNNTADWALYLKTYFKDAMGLPTTFLADLPAYMKADPKFKRRAYYRTSDEALIKWYNRSNNFKKFGRKIPGLRDIPNAPDPKLKSSDPELYNAQMNAHIEALTRLIHKVGRGEAKYQLITILGHPKIMAGNLFGGTQMTITRAGLKNFTRVNNKKWVTENLIKDLNGNYRLKFKDGTEVKTMKDLDSYLSEQGIIENFIANELNLDANYNSTKGAVKKNLQNFFKEIGQKITKDPDVSDQTIADIARKYKVNKIIDSGAGWFMQTSERRLRRDAFLSHAVEYMQNVGGKNALDLSISDPAVIEAGLRGVEATQFIYHSAARPAFMRTALGKTLSRFKLFVFNSVRVRKEMLRKASYYGYEPGTKEFDKFKNDFAINMFVMALGTAFTYSLFDTTLPPPYDWAQETGEWLFGDKKERDKAFFGQWPYPIAPLNIVTPPVARIPMETFSALINKDWERFTDYHAYTMFPFGRMIRSIDKTFDEPYGTTEGRALQQFLGIPLDKVRYAVDREEILRNRKDKINREMEEMYG